MPPILAVRLAALLLASGAAAALPSSAAGAGQAIGQAGEQQGRDTGATAPKPRKEPSAFYDAQEPLAVALTTNLRQLRHDKGDKAPWRAATLSYAGPNGDTVRVPVRARTRGIWRLKSCEFPPVRLDFAGRTAKKTLFHRLDKPKLVNYCHDDDRSEQYILQELQLYRIYTLLSPLSHRARLVRMAYVDSASGQTQTTRYALIVEEPQALADRVGGAILEEKGAGPDVLDPYHAALVGVFQYLIGNTDWSISALHNAELVRDSTFAFIPVPYDFDFAGAVNASYATPDPTLPIKRVRDRVYRGYCVPAEQYAPVFALFNEKKDAIYALYRDQIGRLLEPRTADETLAYFDEFYRTINSPRSAQREIIDACIGGG